MPSKVWDEIINPFPNFNGCWSLGMDKWFYPTFYNGCNCLSMLGFRKKDPKSPVSQLVLTPVPYIHRDWLLPTEYVTPLYQVCFRIYGRRTSFIDFSGHSCSGWGGCSGKDDWSKSPAIYITFMAAIRQKMCSHSKQVPLRGMAH